VEKVWPKLDELHAQRLEVVDLAVEGDGHRAILVVDRLVAALEIDDAQPPEPERRMLIDAVALAVRPAMGDDVGHLLENAFLGINGSVAHKPGYSAHNSPFL
jgi:hypothetical protein